MNHINYCSFIYILDYQRHTKHIPTLLTNLTLGGSEMPVFIYDKDAFEKMILVEGEDYRQFKTEKMFEDKSFDCFKNYWDEVVSKIEEEDRKTYWDECYSPENSPTIYGHHGWNRYAVKYSGEIIFLSFFDESEDKSLTKKAREVGFSVDLFK